MIFICCLIKSRFFFLFLLDLEPRFVIHVLGLTFACCSFFRACMLLFVQGMGKWCPINVQ